MQEIYSSRRLRQERIQAIAQLKEKMDKLLNFPKRKDYSNRKAYRTAYAKWRKDI